MLDLTLLGLLWSALRILPTNSNPYTSLHILITWYATKNCLLWYLLPFKTTCVDSVHATKTTAQNQVIPMHPSHDHLRVGTIHPRRSFSRITTKLPFLQLWVISKFWATENPAISDQTKLFSRGWNYDESTISNVVTLPFCPGCLSAPALLQTKSTRNFGVFASFGVVIFAFAIVFFIFRSRYKLVIWHGLVQYLGFLYNATSIHSESMNEPCNSLSMMMTLAPLFAAYDPIHGEEQQIPMTIWPEIHSILLFYLETSTVFTCSSKVKYHISCYWIFRECQNLKPLNHQTPYEKRLFFQQSVMSNRLNMSFLLRCRCHSPLIIPHTTSWTNVAAASKLWKTAPLGCFPSEGINPFGLSKKTMSFPKNNVFQNNHHAYILYIMMFRTLPRPPQKKTRR